MRSDSSSNLPSIRAKIAQLLLACALPCVLGLGALIYHFYQHEHAQITNDALQTARALGAALDRDLYNAETAALALASSPSLQTGDFSAFDAQARSLLRPSFPGYAIILRDASGQQFVNTSVTPGQPLPHYTTGNRLQPVFEQAKPLLSDLFIGSRTKTPLISIGVPVLREGKVAYALSVILQPARLGAVLAGQDLPAGQTLTIYDSQGGTVAHSGAGAGVSIGQPAAPALLENLRGRREGVLTGSAAGATVYTSFSRSAASGWSVAVATPEALVLGEMRNSLAALAGAVALLLAAGGALAWRLGTRISTSVKALAAAMPAPPPRMDLRETEQVAAALRAMDADLRRHRQQLETLVAERTAELEKSTAQLETVYASAPVGLSFVDPGLRILTINACQAALHGAPAAELIGRHACAAFADPQARAEVERAYRQVLASGRPVTGVALRTNAGGGAGRQSDWIASYYPVYGHDQTLAGITGLLQDVSAHARAEAALRQSKQLLKSIVEHMPAMVFVKRASDLRYEMFNPHAETTLGHARNAIVGKTDHECFDAALADAFVAADRHVLATGEMAEIEEGIGEGSARRYFTTRKVALRNAAGVATHVLGVALDITERKLAAEVLGATTRRLEQSERFIRTVTDNLPGMVSYWDAGLRCRFANQFQQAWFGRSGAGLEGIGMEELFGAGTFAALAPYVDGVLAGHAQAFERELAHPSGVPAHTWTNYIPDLDDGGRVRGFFVLVSDVSVLKRAELRLHELNLQLVRARDKAEAASRAKSEFVANMSHEIRTPMNAIVGLARLLEEAPLDRRERSYVQKIQLATHSLLAVVNDVLDFSRIEAGQVALEHAPFTLDHVLTSTAVLAAGGAWEKGVEPVFAVGADVPAELLGDAMRLQQVLLNLFSNAVKFTARGEVRLAVRTLGFGAGKVVLEFAVRDTGIGISAAQQQHVFDAFSQGDSSTSRKFGGAGLGLAICRRLVALMGGEISLISAAGEGSEFSFSCPFDLPPGAAAAQLAPALRQLEVLIVDDNASAREALRQSCAGFGWQTRCADSGAAGLAALARSARAGRRLDLLLLDGAMPGMDGVTMLTQARAGAHAALLPPVILLVPEHDSEDLAPLAATMALAGLLGKPVTPGRLLAAVAALRSGAAQPPALPAPTPLSGRLAGMRVLLVEDNEINQEVARYILLHAGARVDIAANGQLAVDLLSREAARFDAVLMDLQMPVMNGYQATRAIRALGLSQLPIVAMTANVMDEDLAHTFESGMNAHVAKPIDVDELIATLTRVAPSCPAALPARARREAGMVPQQVPGIELAAALQRFDGDYAVYLGLLKRFENSQGDAVAETRRLLADGKRHRALQVLHRLRGVAANLGAGAIAALSAQAELALKNASESELAGLLGALDEAMAVVISAARTLALPLPEPAPPTTAEVDLPAALAELLTLLQNNNMKALQRFKVLRPAIEAAGREAALTLADAIETLNFSAAEKLVLQMVKLKDSA